MATPGMYLRDGTADTNLSQTGALAPGTPAHWRRYEHAVRNFGKRPLREHLLAAAEIAEKGFPIDAKYASKLKSVAKDLAKFPASRAAFLKAGGSAYREGDTLKQPDLAKSYRAMAEEGTKWFLRRSICKGRVRMDGGEWRQTLRR